MKIFGPDLKTLEPRPSRCSGAISKVPGITDITLVRELGQPSLTIEPDRAKIARYGLNVGDINTLIETAMGGTAATQVIQGERQFDLVVRMQEPFRDEHGGDQEPAGRHARRPAPAAQPVRRHQVEQGRVVHLPRGELALHRRPVQRGGPRPGQRRRGSAQVDAAVKLPIGYKFDWGGEYKEYLAARSQMKVILPLTIVLILLILFALYGNLKFPVIIMFSVLVTEPVGGCWR